MVDKTPEVLVCGASIMKDVWEIRLRDHGQKLQLEEERRQNSSLEKINQEWQVRISSKFKTPKKLARKAKPPEESTLEHSNNTKQINPVRSKGFQGSQLQKHLDQMKVTKKDKLALLLHLNESFPSLVWNFASWKFSQPLPKPEESHETSQVSDWGHSWKLLNFQPKTEDKPWFELGFDTSNNMTSNGIMFLWEKLGKALDTKRLQQDLSSPEWEKSWKFTQKRKPSQEGTTNGPKTGNNCKFNNLSESYHQNLLSDWQESWKSTKPLNEGEARPEIIHEENKKNEEEHCELPWNHSWMYFRKQLYMSSKSTQTSNKSGWVDSWRVSKAVAERGKKSIASSAVMPVEPLHLNIFNVIMNVSREIKHSSLWSSLFLEKDLHESEWEKSWVTIKNLKKDTNKEEPNKDEGTYESMKKPQEEIMVDKPKYIDTKTERAKLPKEGKRVKFEVLALPKRPKHKEMLDFLEQKEKDTFVSTWKDSWKILRCQCGQERTLRDQRRSALELAAKAQKSLTEWANSWKFTNLTLNQDSNLWQQGWSTNTQPTPNRSIRENEMLNEDIPHNGPSGVRSWGESWRSTRRQHLLERQESSTSTQPANAQAYSRSVADWDLSWELPTNQCYQHGPSMTEWRDSWMFCRFIFDNLGVLQPQNTWFKKSMEIKARKEAFRASYKCFRSRDFQSFKERWNDSWRIRKRPDGPGSGLSYLIKEEVLDWDNSWMFTSTDFYQRQGDNYWKSVNNVRVRSHPMLNAVQIESKSEWGKSWRISNPQPPKSIASWVEAKPRSYCAQDVVLWSRDKYSNYSHSALDKEFGKMKIWGKSWRFLKMENNLESKHGKGSTVLADESLVIMAKMTKTRTHVYSNIDKHKPQQKRWTEACKLAKTQPRVRRNIKPKSSMEPGEDSTGLFAEWVESWRFSNGLKSHVLAEMSVSLKDWENSWKFLFDSCAPSNGPKINKGR